MGKQTLTNLLETFVDQAQPVKNYDAGASVYVRAHAGRASLAYLYFNRPFPLGATITSAKLHMYTYAKSVAGSISFYLKMINQTVSYPKVTYNTRPTQFNALAESSVTFPGTYPDRQELIFDITTHMQAVAGSPGTGAGAAKWNGYQLRTNWTNTNYSPRLMSPQYPNPDLRPWVEFEWSDAPSTPTQLSPAGGRYVSTTKPVLGFDYVDVSGDKTLTKCQVQINTSSSFTSPAYDSGEVLVDSPQFDLGPTAFTALVSTLYYWRVRTQDGAGLWSNWSAPSTFRYAALPTISIQNPPAPPNNFVEEPTPPITWNVTGTQTAYSLDLYRRVGDKWVSVYHRGRTASAITDGFTVPVNVITIKNATYLIDIRVWDDLDREAVPNGQVYRLASREFTYQFSALTSPVTNLTVAPRDPLPGIMIEWDRATAPDSYSIIRDGVVIASNLDPDNDTFVSGIHNRWLDRFPVAKKEHTYSVQPIVNGKASTANPEETATNYILGTWLTDAAGDNPVCLVRNQGTTMEYFELSATYDPLGSDHAVLVTQSMGGYRGTIVGEIMTGIPGGTMEEWHENMLTLKESPGQLIMAFLPGATFPVVLKDIKCAPTMKAQRSYGVEALYFQQGNLDYDPRL